MVTFDKDLHRYKNAETGEVYISVSQLISRYREPFKRDFLAEKVAKREKKTKQEILDQWDKNNKDACDKGQRIHSIIEKYLKEGVVDDADLINKFVDIFNRSDYRDIKCEHILYNHNHKLAGTSDCVCDVDELHFDIIDFKTNKKFNFQNNYGEYLKAPLNNLQHCQYNEYSIQLSLYAFLYSSETGKRLRKIEIFYYDNNSFTKIPVPYLYWDIQVLLKHYGQNIVEQG